MDGDEVKGSGLLRIESRNGEFRFTQEFEGGEFRDEVVAVVDRETLQPQSVQRLIEGPEGERRWQVEYEGGTAVVMQRSEDGERRDELTVPTRPYDSWTDVFLWRTIDFREGYEATYADVLSATLTKPQVITQTLKVTGKETVEVPAGSFEAWRPRARRARPASRPGHTPRSRAGPPPATAGRARIRAQGTPGRSAAAWR